MKRMNLRGYAFLFLCLWVFAACNDPIFYTISQEVAPKDPRIPGGPANFAVFTYNAVPRLYAASGSKLHWYTTKNGTGWDNGEMPQPGGRIKSIGATSGYLYAVCYDDSGYLRSSALKRIAQNGTKWETLTADSSASAYPLLQSLYSPDQAGNVVFIGAEFNDGFAILYVDSASGTEMKFLTASDELLTGAASDGTNYYLSTGAGIFQVDSSISTCSPLPATGQFMGIISLETTPPAIAAIERSGQLYFVSAAGAEAAKDSEGKDITIGNFASGGLALWSKGTEKLLLAGKEDNKQSSVTSGFTYGYREFIINTDGSSPVSLSNAREPGSPPSSADDTERYKSTIGKLPVNYLYQAPGDIDAEMTLFAATQKNGVWSYRDRPSGGWQWNAEE
jgi:hypothetical protein